jgi:hypothetical protein
MRSWGFEGFGANKFKYLADKHLAPKAEVTGSNPVGFANDFNNLNETVTLRILPFPDYFRIMCSWAVPGRFGNCTAANC